MLMFEDKLLYSNSGEISQEDGSEASVETHHPADWRDRYLFTRKQKTADVSVQVGENAAEFSDLRQRNDELRSEMVDMVEQYDKNKQEALDKWVLPPLLVVVDVKNEKLRLKNVSKFS